MNFRTHLLFVIKAIVNMLLYASCMHLLRPFASCMTCTTSTPSAISPPSAISSSRRERRGASVEVRTFFSFNDVEVRTGVYWVQVQLLSFRAQFPRYKFRDFDLVRSGWVAFRVAANYFKNLEDRSS